jgi:BMFP domain-containing protein YqiC
MSDIDKQALRERYSLRKMPICKICGGKMSISTASYRRITYVCYGVVYDEEGHHYADGRSLGDEHYEQSKITLIDTSDDEVIALLDELEAAEQRNAELVHNHRVHAARLIDERGQLKQRIAELEAGNARFRFEISRCHQTVDEMLNNQDKWIDKEWIAAIWATSKRLMDEASAATGEAIQRTLAKTIERAEAAEKRIAELEARAVTLPPTIWYEHDDLPRDIPVLSKRLMKKALRDAGIGIKE